MGKVGKEAGERSQWYFPERNNSWGPEDPDSRPGEESHPSSAALPELAARTPPDAAPRPFPHGGPLLSSLCPPHPPGPGICRSRPRRQAVTSCVLGTPRAGGWSGHSSAEWGWDTASGTELSVWGRGGVALQGAEQQETGLQLGGCLPLRRHGALRRCCLTPLPLPGWRLEAWQGDSRCLLGRSLCHRSVGPEVVFSQPRSPPPLPGWEMVVKTSGPSILFPSAPPHVRTRGGSAGGPLGCVSSSPLMHLLDSLTWDWKQGGPDPVDLGAPFPVGTALPGAPRASAWGKVKGQRKRTRAHNTAPCAPPPLLYGHSSPCGGCETQVTAGRAREGRRWGLGQPPSVPCGCHGPCLEPAGLCW